MCQHVSGCGRIETGFQTCLDERTPIGSRRCESTKQLCLFGLSSIIKSMLEGSGGYIIYIYFTHTYITHVYEYSYI